MRTREVIKRDEPENGLAPVHPGEYIADDLEAMEMSPAEYDAALTLPHGTIADIVAERSSMTPELALRLSRYLGTSARFWMNLQVSYDLKIAQQEHGGAIAKQIKPRKENAQLSGGNTP